MLTKRQQQILQSAVAEYINVAQPISSQALEEKYDFGVSPATIRNELLTLSDQGYLMQPHTSSGRVPTDKGYRFLVDQYLLKELEEIQDLEGLKVSLGRQDAVVFQELTRKLALASSVFTVVSWGNLLWKEGWESLFIQPEFESKESLVSFARFLEDFEENIETLFDESTLHISIGRENRFSQVKDFSILMRVCKVSNQEHMVVALMGPKRMAYEKNIQLLQSLADLLYAGT